MFRPGGVRSGHTGITCLAEVQEQLHQAQGGPHCAIAPVVHESRRAGAEVVSRDFLPHLPLPFHTSLHLKNLCKCQMLWEPSGGGLHFRSRGTWVSSLLSLQGTKQPRYPVARATETPGTSPKRQLRNLPPPFRAQQRELGGDPLPCLPEHGIQQHSAVSAVHVVQE